MGWLGWSVAGLFGGWLVFSGFEMGSPAVLRLGRPEGAYALGAIFFWTRVLVILWLVFAGFMVSRRS